MSIRPAWRLLVLAALASGGRAAAVEPELLLDVPTPETCEVRDHLTVGDRFFFLSGDGTHGVELWCTDGTPGATHLVRDLRPGTDSPSIRMIGAAGGRLILSGDDGLHGPQLWSTDGTDAGTIMLTDWIPSTATLLNCTAVGGDSARLFLHTSGEGVPAELVVTAGTPGGTRRLRAMTQARDGTMLGRVLYFCGQADGSGPELWRSDGTPEGTRLVRSFAGLAGQPPAVLGNLLFFAAADTPGNEELWVSDGTPAGTLLMREIHPNSGSFPSGFTTAGDRLFFVATTPAEGRELWCTDGTLEGTRLVRNLAPGANASNPADLVAWQGRLYFIAHDGRTRTLWSTDGTAEGTQTLMSSTTPREVRHLRLAGDRLCFEALEGYYPSHGYIWTSDGTPGGTQRTEPLRSGTNYLTITGYAGAPDPVIAIGRRIFFRRRDAFGLETLWTSDGTAAGTFELPESRDVHPLDVGVFGGRFYYIGPGESGDFRLFVSDGTSAGTHPIFDIGFPTAGTDFLFPRASAAAFSSSPPMPTTAWNCGRPTAPSPARGSCATSAPAPTGAILSQWPPSVPG